MYINVQTEALLAGCVIIVTVQETLLYCFYYSITVNKNFINGAYFWCLMLLTNAIYMLAYINVQTKAFLACCMIITTVQETLLYCYYYSITVDKISIKGVYFGGCDTICKYNHSITENRIHIKCDT